MEILVFASIGHSPNLESAYVRREYRSGYRTIWSSRQKVTTCAYVFVYVYGYVDICIMLG